MWFPLLGKLLKAPFRVVVSFWFLILKCNFKTKTCSTKLGLSWFFTYFQNSFTLSYNPFHFHTEAPHVALSISTTLSLSPCNRLSSCVPFSRWLPFSTVLLSLIYVEIIAFYVVSIDFAITTLFAFSTNKVLWPSPLLDKALWPSPSSVTASATSISLSLTFNPSIYIVFLFRRGETCY